MVYHGVDPGLHHKGRAAPHPRGCSADPGSRGQGPVTPARRCSRKQGLDGGLGSLNSKGQTQGSEEPRGHGRSALSGGRPQEHRLCMWASLGAAPKRGVGRSALHLSRLALWDLSVWLLIQVRLKRCDTKTEAESGRGTAWTQLLDAALGHSHPQLSAHSPCAAGGGRGSGQVGRPLKPPGSELLSYHLGARLSCPLPWTPRRRGRVPAPLRWGEARGQWGCTLRGRGSRPSVPWSGVWAEFPPHPRTDAHLAAAHRP